MELNREQIVKALECCSDCNCPECPYVPTEDCYKGTMGCSEQMMRNALALIRELTEENERLRKTSEDGAECPTCHGIGKIGTTNWLTKHLSKEQIAKEKAEAVAEFHRELRADTVRKMQERLCEGRVSNDPVVIAATVTAKEMLEEDKDEGTKS